MLGEKKANIKTGNDFEPIPVDKYTVQVTDVNWKTKLNYQGVEQDFLNFTFTILDDKPLNEDGDTVKGRLLWWAVTESLGSRSNLGKLATAIIGRELTKEEKEAFDPEDLIGKQVDVLINQTVSKTDSTMIFNNIIGVSKTIKKLKAVDVEAKPAPITKKTVAAVAPDAQTPDAMIAQLEEEKKTTTAEVDNDTEAAEAELEAAELAAKAARARADLAKKKAQAKG